MSKDLWIAEYERIGDDLADGSIDEETAAARLKALGLDAGEIRDHLDVWREDIG